MLLEIEGIAGRTSLKTLIERKLTDALDGRVKSIAARVGFVDENGPKGGPAMRCAITVEVARRAPLHVEQRAETERRAFDGALEALERKLEHTRGKVQTERRRPKKYFLAKRLLSPEESLDTLGTPTPRRRSAPRRSR